MKYTFKIKDKDGKCTEYKHIIKACYTIPVPGATETVVEGEDLFTHRYKPHYDLYLYSENEAFTISKRAMAVIEVVKEN